MGFKSLFAVIRWFFKRIHNKVSVKLSLRENGTFDWTEEVTVYLRRQNTTTLLDVTRNTASHHSIKKTCKSQLYFGDIVGISLLSCKNLRWKGNRLSTAMLYLLQMKSLGSISVN